MTVLLNSTGVRLDNMESQEALVPTVSQGEECAGHTVFKSRVLWALLCGLFSGPIFFQLCTLNFVL